MRLTERKVAYPHCDKQGNLTQVDYIEIKDKELAEEKLCQLEDIEDELGIDLITLFKVLNADKVYNRQYGYYDMCSIDIEEKLIFFDNKEIDEKKPIDTRPLKQYGKTWALTKEELL